MAISKTESDPWVLGMIFAHELTHLIRYRASQSDPLWLNEGIARQVEYLLADFWPNSLNHETDALKNKKVITPTLFELSDSANDYKVQGQGYANSFLFMHYLLGRYGDLKLWSELIRSEKSGWDAIESWLENLSSRGVINLDADLLKRRAIWRHFAFALMFNDPNIVRSGLFLVDYKYQGALNSKSEIVDTNIGVRELEKPWSVRGYLVNQATRSTSENFNPNFENTEYYFIQLPLKKPSDISRARNLEDFRRGIQKADDDKVLLLQIRND